MRLIHTSSLTLKEFLGDDVPRYAILSHTWGKEEVTYNDMRNQSQNPVTMSRTEGGRKIRTFCQIAKELGYTWVWVDTCCIDKSSSSELSEAINSMLRWYSDAAECLAYLSDVNTTRASLHPEQGNFVESRWFRRGWTLQELLAPRYVEFYNQDWKPLGEKRQLWRPILKACRIAPMFLVDWTKASTAQRMAWASTRVTTRAEDAAYCLLGLFDVNMPLLYGEGATKAFERLQRDVLRNTEDLSILAWHEKDIFEPREEGSLLASSPQQFRDCIDVVSLRNPFSTCRNPTFSMTKAGLQIKTQLYNESTFGRRGEKVFVYSNEKSVLMQLNCAVSKSETEYYHVYLALDRSEDSNESNAYARVGTRSVSATGDHLYFHIYLEDAIVYDTYMEPVGPPETIVLELGRHRRVGSMIDDGHQYRIEDFPELSQESTSLQKGIVTGAL